MPQIRSLCRRKNRRKFGLVGLFRDDFCLVSFVFSQEVAWFEWFPHNVEICRVVWAFSCVAIVNSSELWRRGGRLPCCYLSKIVYTGHQKVMSYQENALLYGFMKIHRPMNCG